MVNFHAWAPKVFEPLVAGDFTKVKGWKGCGSPGSSILRYAWHPARYDEELVVVKAAPNAVVDRWRDQVADDRTAFLEGVRTREDVLNEIGVYAYLQDRPHQHALRLLGVL